MLPFPARLEAVTAARAGSTVCINARASVTLIGSVGALAGRIHLQRIGIFRHLC